MHAYMHTEAAAVLARRVCAAPILLKETDYKTFCYEKHFFFSLKLRSWIDYCNSRKNFTLPRIDPPLYDTTGQTTEPPKYAKTSIQV